MAAPTLQQLTYFVAAVDHGSFVAAAEATHVAQPSLSEQVRRLSGHWASPSSCGPTGGCS